MNGPIERYMLYLSTNLQSLGSAVYNTSQLLLFHTLTNLTAATQYFIRLAVSPRTITVIISVRSYTKYNEKIKKNKNLKK